MAQFHIFINENDTLLLADWKEKKILDGIGFKLVCSGYTNRDMPDVYPPMITAKEYLSKSRIGQIYRIDDDADKLIKIYNSNIEALMQKREEDRKERYRLKSKSKRVNKFYIHEEIADVKMHLVDFIKCCEKDKRSLNSLCAKYVDLEKSFWQSGGAHFGIGNSCGIWLSIYINNDMARYINLSRVIKNHPEIFKKYKKDLLEDEAKLFDEITQWRIGPYFKFDFMRAVFNYYKNSNIKIYSQKLVEVT